MRATSLLQLTDWAGGSLIQGVSSATVSRLVTNSREVGPGDVFLAIKGENHNAHDYLDQAFEAGAAAVIVSELPGSTEGFDRVGIIHLRDTLKALQQIALQHRKSDSLFVVAVTGSNGKTSTKDFLAAVLSANGPVNKTSGNFNNHIGLPLTILAGDESHTSGVWEMGMNHAGEIELLAEIGAPDAAVITHIGTAHIEHLKTREAIAAEKASLAEAIPSDGFCVMPLHDDYYDFVAARVSCRMISVGVDQGEVRAEGLRLNERGESCFSIAAGRLRSCEIQLPIRGRHMVINAVLAAAVGLEQGVGLDAIADSLSSVELTGGRLQEKTIAGRQFLDDSYNANPDSMKAAIATLEEADVAGRRVAVLGYMGELGELEADAHRELGELVSRSNVDELITVTEAGRQIQEGVSSSQNSSHFDDHADAAVYLAEILASNDLALIKGSRGAKMEAVIHQFEKNTQTD
ncbi:MAG: UDP-N-acetylmuramoyl-tripeptide--D-alanyl-D-alanine ligase [Verrucomicrobiota bacterium]